jgi:hypothetical protein
LTLRPHIERAGFHTERFDALLDGEVICTSRSGWNDPARALLALGYPPETLLHVQHEGKPPDPGIVPQPIGELAKWTWEETSAGGIKKRRWRPVEERFTATARGWQDVQECDASTSGQEDAGEVVDAFLEPDLVQASGGGGK